MNSPPTRPRPLYLLLFLLIAFTTGVMLERYGWLPSPSPGRQPPPGLGHTFDPFWETWNLVDAHYVDRDAVQSQRMTQGAIEGMLASLGDFGHTTYLTRDEVTRLDNSLNGRLEGIGATLTIRNRRPTVVQTMPESPAAKAGLKPGDVLLEVDGHPVAELPLDRIVGQVRGDAGTAVRIRVAREGSPRPLDFRIERARVDVPDVVWHLLPGTAVAHLIIREFGLHAHEQLEKAIGQLRAAKVKGLIVDLRGNTGGLKEQAVAVTSEFLADGVVFIEQNAEGRQKPVSVREGGALTDLPVCVLIDLGTASSAEIFAGAVQDHGRAKLVGTRTFGTGTVLQPFPLSDGSAVLLAIAEWLTPNGRRIWHQGIAPDYVVAMPEGAFPLFPDSEEGLSAAALAKSSDKQLLKGLEVLKGQVK